MSTVRSTIAASALLLCVLVACAERGEEAAAASRAAYAGGVGEACALYCRLHPLRGSRLGMRSSDSLLFTFSEEEIAEAIGGIDRLAGTLSSVSPRHLDPEDADNLATLMHWLNGERFALEELALHRRNPLLYCWIVEEALFGMPSRPQPPYPGEARSYERRIARIAPLLSNAERLLDSPAERHVDLAIRRIDDLRAKLGSLELLLAERYGSVPPALEDVRRSLELFARRCSADLEQRAFGSILLGTDNLARIFLCDEGLVIESARLGREAQERLAGLRTSAAAIRRRVEAAERIPIRTSPRAPELDSVLVWWEKAAPMRPVAAPRSTRDSAARVPRDIEALEEALERSNRFGTRRREPLLVRSDDGAPGARLLAAAPYLSLPLPESPLIVAEEPSIFAEPPCNASLVVYPALAESEPDAFAYALFGVLYPAREIGRLVCASADTVRTLLPSETFREAWDLLQRESLIECLGARRAAFELMLIEDKRRSLARLHVVLGLHAGTLTSDAAVAYLTETIDGLSVEEARAEYVLASVSPAIAYRGIALIMIEELVKLVESEGGSATPRQRLIDHLRRHAGAPLPLLEERLRR